MRITDAANTYNFAIHILINENCKVRLLDSDDEIFVAENNNQIYKSDTPLSLLGLFFLKNTNIECWNKSIHIADETLLSINYLTSMGFDINISNKYSENWFDFIVINNEIEIIGATPLNIIGLYLIYKEFGIHWSNSKIPNYMVQLME